ncbi:MAG: 3-hydroxyacyl-[acyl-carrier-protein] dehydratase [Litorivivens sp.]|jgi:3-hydroxyacyl-[acyl-carrier-protein] dehydratase
MKNMLDQLLQAIPQEAPFRFVDELTLVDETSAQGSYRFKADEHFYKGHFPNHPITPGVILTETMAQIGLIPLGAFLMIAKGQSEPIDFVLAETKVEFLKPVYPEDRVFVKSALVYFRFGKLKCKVSMTNDQGEELCRGELSGMVVKRRQDE